MRPTHALLFLMSAACALAQRPSNFLQQAFGVQPLERSPLLAPEFPNVSLLLVNRSVEVAARRGRQRRWWPGWSRKVRFRFAGSGMSPEHRSQPTN
jgi:hypothetical protein